MASTVTKELYSAPAFLGDMEQVIGLVQRFLDCMSRDLGLMVTRLF